jgi:hypothetical protein
LAHLEQTGESQICQIASNCDPLFACNNDPLLMKREAVHRGTRARSGALRRSAAKRAGVAVGCLVGTIFRRDF